MSSLCKSLVIPDWYTPPAIRAEKAAEVARLRNIACQTKAAKEAALEQLSAVKKIYWEGLDSVEQERYCAVAKEKMPPGIVTPRLVEIMAIEVAWEQQFSAEYSS